MKRTHLTLAVLLATALATGGQSAAQQRAATAKDDGKTTPKKLPEAAVFLANTALSEGLIPDRVFDSLATLRLTARDKAGTAARVVAYTLTFAERSLAEDSAGRPFVAVDYFSEVCYGDTLNAVLRANLLDRTKAGDTVWYDRIQVATAAGQAVGKAMKFVIGR